MTDPVSKAAAVAGQDTRATTKRRVTVGAILAPQFGPMARLRRTWEECDEMGVDRIYTADHFHAMIVPKIEAEGAVVTATLDHENFEGGSIEAAMAVTTRRAQIGCLVHAIGYRNPNLLADMARTMDHLSGGRFILGLGSGYLKADYDEYGFSYGTAGDRIRELDRGIQIIKARLEKLNPRPLRKIPLLIAGLGEKVMLRVVATHADIWHCYGPLQTVQHKTSVLEDWCTKVGRDSAAIERATYYEPMLIPNATPDDYLALGFTQIINNVFSTNCAQDLSIVRELVEWRDRVNARLS